MIEYYRVNIVFRIGRFGCILVCFPDRTLGNSPKVSFFSNGGFVQQTVSINLPSSVFASEFEEEVGLLNKAAPVSGETPGVAPFSGDSVT